MRSLLLLAAILAGMTTPVARFGRDHELGRIDLLSIHGLSPARIDGVGDVPHAALALSVALAAAWATVAELRGRATHATLLAEVGGVLLVLLVLARVVTHAPLGVTVGPGLGALGVLFGAALSGRIGAAPGPPTRSPPRP